MKRTEIRTFIRNGVNNLTPSVQFDEGVFTDWNARRDKSYPSILSELEETNSDILTSTTPLFDTWPIKLSLCLQDKIDSIPDFYEPLVDQCDDMARKLIYSYRALIAGYKLMTIENIKRIKFVKSSKKGADLLTGIELTFDLKNQDQSTDIC